MSTDAIGRTEPPNGGVPQDLADKLHPDLSRPPYFPQPVRPWCDKWPVIIRSITRQQELLRATPPEIQQEYFKKTLTDLTDDGLLEEGEAESLLAASSGARVHLPPPVSPDGSPSLCGTLGATLSPSIGLERSRNRDFGIAIGAMAGAGIGGALGGVGGAIAGAGIGSVIASHALRE
ncbi:hypothetical protein ACIBL8_47935 [Streptomyces sp. NPDC050523]|uniref:hypothetical protein n=1 Tax=Streptomyces sp. NPDC050523 TaxID=3365622 RepID=UPI0037BB40BB